MNNRHCLKPFTILQPTSVHGLRTTSSTGFDFPVNDRIRSRIRHQRYTMAKHMRNRAEILNQYFDPVSDKFMYTFECRELNACNFSSN